MTFKVVATVGALLLASGTPLLAQPRPPQAAPSAPAAQAPRPAPEQTSQVFGDWTHRCLRVRAEPADLSCEVVSAVQAQAPGQQPMTVQLALGASETAGRTRLVVAVPANVLLSTPLRLVRDGVTLPDLSYDSCLSGFCRGTVEFDEPTLQRLLDATSEGRISYQTANRQELQVIISFRGLKDAVAALRRGVPRN